jgi:hypothetical protein
MIVWQRLASVVPIAVASCQYPPLPALELDAIIDAPIDQRETRPGFPMARRRCCAATGCR